MNYSKCLLLTSFFSLLFSITLAQNSFREYPQELKSEKLIFLEYEIFEESEELEKSKLKALKIRNAKAKAANEQLKIAVENYPFGYVVAKRAEIDSLNKAGFRYVLENDMMKMKDDKESVLNGKKSAAVTEMYIIDIDNEAKYYLFQIGESYAFFYKGVMKKFLNQVEKKYF